MSDCYIDSEPSVPTSRNRIHFWPFPAEPSGSGRSFLSKLGNAGMCIRTFCVFLYFRPIGQKKGDSVRKMQLDQSRAPIYEALERFRQMRVVPFDVPGHKRGRGNPELTAFLGEKCVNPIDAKASPNKVFRMRNFSS